MESPFKPKNLMQKARLASGEGSAGTDMVANTLVGLFLGWLVQSAWPVLEPWGMVGGVVLGTISGFYQLFKGERLRAERDKEKRQSKQP